MRLVLAGQPEPPKYFGTMKRINKEGPRLLGGLPRPTPMDPESVVALLDRGELVVDTRTSTEYASGHLPGSVNIPFNNAFTTWVGWIVPYDREVYLLSAKPDGRQSELALRDMAMIGLDRVTGTFGADALGAWNRAGRSLASYGRITAQDLAARLAAGTVQALDVRSRAEWEAGHIDGVANIFAGELVDRLDEVPRGRPLVVHCQGGTRSAIAASLLDARGIGEILDQPGGFNEWEGAGLPVVREHAATAGARPGAGPAGAGGAAHRLSCDRHLNTKPRRGAGVGGEISYGGVRCSSRGGTRTPDPVINSHLLYQLSYSGRQPQARVQSRLRCHEGQAVLRGRSAGRTLPP